MRVNCSFHNTIFCSIHCARPLVAVTASGFAWGPRPLRAQFKCAHAPAWAGRQVWFQNCSTAAAEAP